MRVIALSILFFMLFAPQGYALELMSKGPDAVGGKCGGFPGAVCSEKEWCDYPANSVCGIADVQGTCRPRPEICTQAYIPVCGCNDVTYSNACVAAANGTDVAYAGRCRGDPRKTQEK